tara:strand:- start:108 stop:383 length:276 start_codon:yes stop_codon:yes gene_type:complete
MKKISILALILSFLVSTFAVSNEVNIFNARHYKADSELYGKFTAATGIKVNLINGKSGALEKRIIEEGADSVQTFTSLLMLEDVVLFKKKV